MKETAQQQPVKPAAPEPETVRTPMQQAELEDYRGSQALLGGRFDEAIQKHEGAIRLDATKPAYLMHLAKAYAAAKKYREAIKIARQAMAMPSADRDVRLASALIAGDAVRECVAARRTRCSDDPILADGAIDRLDKDGSNLLSANQIDEYLAIFLRAYAYSGKPRPLLRIAAFELQTGKHTDAMAHAVAVRNALPKSDTKFAAETEELIEKITVACEQKNIGCYQRPAAPPMRPAQTTPRSIAAEDADLDSEVLTKQGNDALAAGDEKEALRYFVEATRQTPLEAKYVFNLAVAYQRTSARGKAVAAAQRVLTMASADRAMKMDAAILAGDTVRRCVLQRDTECTKDALLSAAELERLDREGQALVQAQKRDDALPIFLRAYAYSGNARARLRIATFEYVTGRYKSALEHARWVRDTRDAAPGLGEADLRKETDELIRAILADCKQAKANCGSN